MVVRLKFQLGTALALFCIGCAGNVLEGAPLDGGENDVTAEPVADAAPSNVRPTGETADAGTRPVNNTPVNNTPVNNTPTDAGSIVPTPVADSGQAAPKDAGAVVTPAVDAGVVSMPAGGRDLSTDKAKFAGSPRCNNAAATFCDDFESQAAGATPGQAWGYPYDFRPKVDTAHAMRGKNALYFESAASVAAHVEVVQTFPALSANLFGRMFVWIDQLPTTPNNARWNLVAARGTGNAAEVRLGGQIESTRDNKNYFGIGSDYGESGTWQTSGKDAEATVREKAWMCVEWQFKSDSSETNVWIDGVEQKSLHLTATEYRDGDTEQGKKFTFPSFDKLRIGWWLYQGNATPSPTKLWIDEVIFDKARIGCVL
jgi:hypothetical protein